MKFLGLLYTVAVFGAFVNNVNTTVEIGFKNAGGNNFDFSCNYNGIDRESTSKIDKFASIINDLHGDTV